MPISLHLYAGAVDVLLFWTYYLQYSASVKTRPQQPSLCECRLESALVVMCNYVYEAPACRARDSGFLAGTGSLFDTQNNGLKEVFLDGTYPGNACTLHDQSATCSSVFNPILLGPYAYQEYCTM